MTRALVTGATGFIGPHLVEALRQRNSEIACLVRRTSNVAALEQLDVELVYGDVTDGPSVAAAIGDTDVVYHLAGVTKSLRPARDFGVNEVGVRNVAQACADRETPPVLVVVSSLAAAGPTSIDRPHREDGPSRPNSWYGRSKAAGERAAASLADRLPVTIIRPPIVFGEGDVNMLAMFRQARLGMLLAPTLRRQRVSLIHAADLSALAILAADRGERIAPCADDENIGRGLYYVAYDEHPRYGELGRMIGKALGNHFVIPVPVPAPFTWFVAASSELVAQLRRQPFIFNLDKAREATAGSWWCSPQKAHELGWQPAASLAERLRQSAEWYRAQGWL